MKYGLTKIVINKICNVFSRFPEVEKVILYGSRAMNNYKKGSDIDLTIYGSLLTSSTLMNISNELDNLLLQYKIDLSIFSDIDNVDLKDHIKRVGIIFYEKT